MNLEERSINAVRMLSVDAIEKANSGHPGLPLGAAAFTYELWANHLSINPDDQKWINRDRFVLSAGHGSAMLYSLLHLFGFGLTIDDLKEFRQVDSLTPGHPEYKHTNGVECTTGPLGQGIAMAVGMAMAEEHLAAMYNKDDLKLIDHYTYVVCGDGDLMEGVALEAISLAGTLNLNKLIVLYDSNKITIEGSTDLAFREGVVKKFEACGWCTREVSDGNNLMEINEAINSAKKDPHPSLIKINTKIGYGSPVANSSKAHGSPLGADNLKATKEYFGYSEEPFHVDEDVYENIKSHIENKKIIYEGWKRVEHLYKEKYPEDYKNLMDVYENKNKESFLNEEDFYSFDKDLATRANSGEIINRIANKVNYLFGGSADLAPSNNTHMNNSSNFSAEDRLGNNINFGIREHAMGAITNGILLHGGLRSYGGTFLVFSDYMKPALRLASLQMLPNIFVLTHDSIGVGEDGPTHQPVDQIPMLRSIPNMIVFRPADGFETAVAWKVAMNSTSTPVCLILTRQKLKRLNSSINACKGAYIIKKEEGELEKIVIASGSEVSIALEAAEGLKGVRVVSMPSMELFEAQPSEYREEVLPSNIEKRISVEAASTFGWAKYVGLKGVSIGMESFGMSGPGPEVFEYFGITSSRIREELEKL